MEHGLVDGEVLLLHVLEDGRGPADVSLLWFSRKLIGQKCAGTH